MLCRSMARRQDQAPRAAHLGEHPARAGARQKRCGVELWFRETTVTPRRTEGNLLAASPVMAVLS